MRPAHLAVLRAMTCFALCVPSIFFTLTANSEEAGIRKPLNQLDCITLSESARRLRATSLEMLSSVEKEIEKMKVLGERMGSDVVGESLEVLMNQRTQIRSTLREIDSLTCASKDRPY